MEVPLYIIYVNLLFRPHLAIYIEKAITLTLSFKLKTF